MGRRGVFEAFVNFILEPSPDRVHECGRFDLQLGGVNQFVVEETGKEQAEQVGRDRGNRALGGQIFSVEMVDASDARIGSQELVG